MCQCVEDQIQGQCSAAECYWPSLMSLPCSWKFMGILNSLIIVVFYGSLNWFQLCM